MYTTYIFILIFYYLLHYTDLITEVTGNYKTGHTVFKCVINFNLNVLLHIFIITYCLYRWLSMLLR